jgi:hypothetical protein
VSDDDRMNLLDFRRAACLCDAGQPDYTAVAAVSPAGQVVTLWLWHRDGPDRAHANDPPAHEHVGPLPRQVQARVDRKTFPRCGQPRADGRPCRRHVGQPGQPCHQHRIERKRNER